MISVCLIVKNEADKIEKCLNSIKEFADELIIVDTGSTDNTINIIKKYTPFVYEFKWCDDFAKARNFAISKATKKYIFQLDADEIFNNEISQNLRQLLIQKNPVLVNTTIKEFTSKESFYIAKANNPRIFLNRNDIQYYRPYHEMVTKDCNKIAKNENLEIINFNDIVTTHYGYDYTTIEQKHSRGINIMSKWIENNPNDDYILSKLAHCYLEIANIDKAYELSKKAYGINNNKKDNIFIYSNILLTLDKNQNVIKVLNNIKNNNIKDEFFYNLIGSAYFNSKNYSKAKKFFLKAININPNYSNSFSNLGLIYMLNNEYEKAIKNFTIATNLNNQDFNSFKNLAWMYAHINKIDNMIVNLQKSLNINPKQNDILSFIKDNNLIDKFKIN
jgi:glycosyltransferase involved in cell wall biosynthesis